MTDLLYELLEQARVVQDLNEYLDRNEQGDAELFALLMKDKVLYDHSEKQWYLWQGTYWAPDKTGKVYLFVSNDVAASYLSNAQKDCMDGDKKGEDRFVRRARELRSRRRANDVLNWATNLPGLALDGTEWDLSPLLLPVSNGLIDLRTGGIREALPSDRIRSMVPTEWQGIHCPAPLWERTISEIFNRDEQLISFIQRLFGYAITGETKEQKLPIFWGLGANGKSTLVDTVSAVLGDDICFTTQTDSLMDTKFGEGNAPRPFVYASRNKRLIWASESKEGRQLNTALVKQLTGDGKITVRTLHSFPITFRQTYKIFLITNHCPILSDSDDIAIWRRVLRVPFNWRFVDDPRLPNELRRDKDIGQKLKEEYPGILAWLVRGCLEWQKQGLNPPPSVIESTEKYRASEDLIGQFFEECLAIGENFDEAAGAVYKGYQKWCEENGNNALSSRAFGQRMTRRFGESVTKWKDGKSQRSYQGLKLNVH